MIVRTTEDLIKVVDFIKNNHIISLDIETNSLNTRKGKIIGFGISNNKESYYIPHLEWDGEELKQVLSKCDCIDLLEFLKGKQLIGWNLSFDTRYIKNYFEVNLIPDIYCDVMLLKHAVDEERPFALKEVAAKIYGADATQEKEELQASIKSNGGTATQYYKADTDVMAKYCEQDGMLAFNLYGHYSPQLRKEGLESFFYEEESMPLYREVTIPMEEGGVPLDMELLKQTDKELKRDIKLLEDKIQQKIKPYTTKFRKWYFNKEYKPSRTGSFLQGAIEYFGISLPRTKSGKYSTAAKHIESLPSGEFKDFATGKAWLPPDTILRIQEYMSDGHILNLKSKHHLKKIFFDELGEKAVSYTDKGNPQIDEKFLEVMKDKYDFVPLLLDYNKLSKLEGAYIERFLEQQEDGIFYPSFLQHRTISGRYGSDLQQLPRAIEKELLDEEKVSEVVYKYTNRIRRLFISGSNFRFVDADYESLEPHVFAHVSGDEKLRSVFRHGLDFYSSVAIGTEKLEGVSADKSAENYLGAKKKALRQKAKAYVLGIPYGMSPYALGKSLNVSENEAKLLYDNYLNAFPDLKRWMESSNDKVRTDGFVKSEAGRIRHMPLAKKLHAAYGTQLLDPLHLYSSYNHMPKKYEQMKYLRKQMKNFLNNGKNFQIQSLSASIVNRSALAINRYMRDNNINGYVCLQIHDEILIRVEEAKAEHMMVVMQDLMENTYTLTVPLKASSDIRRLLCRL